jgi:hypothetical protein
MGTLLLVLGVPPVPGDIVIPGVAVESAIIAVGVAAGEPLATGLELGAAV